ncbi:MAG TPA: 2-oxoacid:acceptor oxidoreductase subunit alpha [Anaerolineae bacterium]|nr:2-oxoacid:acceptor oxidoreductase subunit alpha [Anaerolineae bacterium]
MAEINNMTFKIAGAAGQGLESSGAGFAQALAQGGLHIFGLQDYMSRIRGGLNFFQIRVHEQTLYCHEDAVHILLPLNSEALETYQDEVVKGGGIIYDEELNIDRRTIVGRGRKAMPVPLVEIAKEHGERVMANTAALGAAAGVAEYAYERLAQVIRINFKRKGDEVVAANLRVARAAYLYAQERYAADFGWKLKEVPGAPQRMVMAGNPAFAMGALAGGCRFVSAYPMTPATSIIEWMAKREHQFGVVTKHAEDEIAAVNMAIGANFVGARAMTATSGGGFALMAEALGLAGMCEVPLVLFEAQRGGPSTGLPTRTEQSDLLFVLSASQGEFPRLVLAPGSIEECFECGWRAFNLAEKYQTPVIVLSDQLLASSVRTVEMEAIDFDQVVIDRGKLMSSEDLDAVTDPYKRHLFSDDGISPRALPGHPNAVHATASDEHDEYGHITEEQDNRVKMMQKRMKKLETAKQDIDPPTRYGPEEAPLALVGWGSTYGVLREVVDRLEDRARLVHFRDLWPFPVEAAAEALGGAKVVAVENNYTGQLKRLLQSETCIKVDLQISRYDGRPFSPQDVLAGLKEVL